MSEARIDVVIGSAQAQSGANALRRAVDDIRGNFIDLAAKAFVVDQTIRKVWSSASQGAQFEETLARLNRQMGGFNSSGQSMVSTLQAITQGTLGIDKAATLASRALATGLNPSQVETFTQAAMLLKNVMGTELPQAFDEIVSAAISGRAAVLGNIGVYVDLDEEIKKLAVSSNRTTDQITKQEKAMLTAKAITEQIAEATHKLSDGMLSDADRLKQVEVRWDNLWTTIGQGAKTAVITSLDWLEKLKAGIEKSIETEMKGRREMEKATPGNPNNPLTQQIFGQAIVQDTTGRINRDRDAFTRAASTTVKTQLPTALQGSQLDAERTRREQAIAGDLDRIKAGLEAASKLYELDAQRQLLTQEELTNAKGIFRLREIAAVGESLNREKQMEDQLHMQRVAIGFQSTEERINEEERYRGKVFEINDKLKTNVQALGIASVETTQENEQAKEHAVTQSAQRNIESWKSYYDITERLRQQDSADAQTYYQGEFDMANARFAGDQELARKEREQLREQLAFKLRLTQEEADRILFLRKANDFEGVRQIAGRADPALNPRAVEGIIESATAKDMLASERANGDFFAGWARGLQKYSQDRDSAFGMSADMARRAAQGMEQGFQQFFFKGMEGQFNSFKDVLSGVLDFTKQIVSQMAAQMVTVGIINPGAVALGNVSRGFSVGTRDVSGVNVGAQKFSSGGMDDFGAGRLAELHGIEAVVPLPDGRSIPVTMRMPSVAPQVQVPISIQVVNKVPQAEVSVQRSTGSSGKEEIMILIEKAVDTNLAQGRHDKTLGQRFGVTPGRG